MKTKQLGCLLFTALTCGLCAFGGDEEQITINSVVATPRYPWNGIWDIVVDISMPANKSVNLEFEAKDSQTGKRLTCGAVQRSDGGPMLAANGKTRFVWFTDRDLGTGITEHVTVGVTPAPHMIIDVSGGPDATGYPVSIQYLLDVPASTGWTDEYKTTKIAMRWIRPGVFDREGYSDYPQISSNYWMAVFETTQRQYEMVTGLKRGTFQGPMRPVESLTLVEMTNYVACLAKKTGRKFDLPDKSAWEYACRAGATSPCYDGTSNCVRKASFAGSGSSVDLGRYAGNCDDGKGEFAEHTNVGMYVPNAYGLYDMLGNVGEFAKELVRKVPDYGYSGSMCNVGAYKGDWYLSSGSYYYRGYPDNYTLYVHKGTSHYLAYRGGGYKSTMSVVTSTSSIGYTDSVYNAPSYAVRYLPFTLANITKQPYGFNVNDFYSISSGSANGFRLYCNAE